MPEELWIRPHRPRRPVRTTLAFGGLALLMCCVGAAGLGAFSLQSVWRADGPVRDTADGFLHEITNGDPARAYERLCGEARKRWSQNGFVQWVRTPPVVTQYEIADVSVATRAGRPRGTVTVRLTRASGPPEQRAIPVVRESRGWRVCGDPF